MKTISNREFCANPDLYMGVAAEQEVRVRRGRMTYRIICEPTATEQPIHQPDEKLRRAITCDEFKQRALETVEKVHRKFYGNEREVSPRRP